MKNTDWAKKYLEKAEDDLISNESGIYIQASIASAMIAIAEKLEEISESLVPPDPRAVEQRKYT